MKFYRHLAGLIFVCCLTFAVGCDRDSNGKLVQPATPMKPKFKFVFEPKASRTSDGNILIEATETTGAGAQVFRATDLLIISVLDDGAQPARFRPLNYKIRFKDQDSHAPKNLVLEMTIASPVTDVLGLIEGIVEFRVGSVQEVVIPLTDDGSSLSSHPLLDSVGITGSMRIVSNVGLKLDGENTGQINKVRLVNGSEMNRPNQLSRSGSEASFGWYEVKTLNPESEILVWMKGSELDAPADWSIKLDPNTTTIQHPSLDISGDIEIQSLWDVQLSGTKSNLLSAAVLDTSGQPANRRPRYGGSGETNTISMLATGSSLNLHVRLSDDGAINKQSFRFTNVPIQN